MVIKHDSVMIFPEWKNYKEIALKHKLVCQLKQPDLIGWTVPLLKPSQSPHCYLGAIDQCEKSRHPLATLQARCISPELPPLILTLGKNSLGHSYPRGKSGLAHSYPRGKNGLGHSYPLQPILTPGGKNGLVHSYLLQLILTNPFIITQGVKMA